jgi:hypothetical protein
LRHCNTPPTLKELQGERKKISHLLRGITRRRKKKQKQAETSRNIKDEKRAAMCINGRFKAKHGQKQDKQKDERTKDRQNLNFESAQCQIQGRTAANSIAQSSRHLSSTQSSSSPLPLSRSR